MPLRPASTRARALSLSLASTEPPTPPPWFQAQSLLERLRKVGSFLVTLPYLVSVVPKLSKLQREVAGIEPYGPPTTQLNQHHVIVTNIEMFDVSNW